MLGIRNQQVRSSSLPVGSNIIKMLRVIQDPLFFSGKHQVSTGNSFYGFFSPRKGYSKKIQTKGKSEKAPRATRKPSRIEIP